MKLKKIVAGMLTVFMVFGSVPNLMYGQIKDVKAVTLPDETSEWMYDGDGNKCKVLFKYTGWVSDQNSSVPEGKGVIEGALGRLIDGDLTTNVVGRGNTSGYANDGVQIGDYVGIQYKESITLNSVKIVYDELFKGGAAKLEYSTDKTLSEGSWNILQDDIETPNGTSAIIEHTLENPIPNVYGVRLTSKVKVRSWMNLKEFTVVNGNVLRLEEADLVAGSSHPDHESKEGPVKYMIDNNTGTYWHTEWTERQNQKFWVDVNVADDAGNAQEINKLVLKNRPSDNNHNGMVAKYEIWAKEEAAIDSDFESGKASGTELEMYPWKANYKKVCDGTIGNDGQWHALKFDPIKVRQIRLVAVETYTGNTLKTTPEYASIVELRVGKGTTNFEDFKGMSLRAKLDDGTPYENHDKTSLRFGFDLYDVPEYRMTGWSWKWGLSEDKMTATVSGESKKQVSEGTYVTNLVIQNIPKNYYATPIYTQLITSYVNDNGDEMTLYGGIENRTIIYVADKVLTEPENKEYAQKILDAYKSTLNIAGKATASYSEGILEAPGHSIENVNDGNDTTDFQSKGNWPTVVVLEWQGVQNISEIAVKIGGADGEEEIRKVDLNVSYLQEESGEFISLGTEQSPVNTTKVFVPDQTIVTSKIQVTLSNPIDINNPNPTFWPAISEISVIEAK